MWRGPLRSAMISRVDHDDARTELARLQQLLADAEEQRAHHDRAAAGFRQMIDGLVSIFPDLDQAEPTRKKSPAREQEPTPATEDTTPTDGTAPRAGTAQEHVTAVLAAAPRTWMTAGDVTELAAARGWTTNSADPGKIIYRALDDLKTKQEIATKKQGRSRVYRAK